MKKSLFLQWCELRQGASAVGTDEFGLHPAGEALDVEQVVAWRLHVPYSLGDGLLNLWLSVFVRFSGLSWHNTANRSTLSNFSHFQGLIWSPVQRGGANRALLLQLLFTWTLCIVIVVKSWNYLIRDHELPALDRLQKDQPSVEDEYCCEQHKVIAWGRWCLENVVVDCQHVH